MNNNVNTIRIKVSNKWLYHKFNCSIDYIRNICHGQCCGNKDNLLVCLLPSEVEWNEKYGFHTLNGVMLPSYNGLCPHKETNGFCSLHGTGYKPFGCIISPFTINNKSTLIIRYRYIFMKCHGTGLPAYKVFRSSLDLLFGGDLSEFICSRIEHNDIYVDMSKKNYNNLIYLDKLKMEYKKRHK